MHYHYTKKQNTIHFVASDVQTPRLVTMLILAMITCSYDQIKNINLIHALISTDQQKKN